MLQIITGTIPQCGKNLREHSPVSVIHYTLTLKHILGQRVIKIWVQFKLPHQLTPKSPSSCNTGLDYYHTSKLGSTAKRVMTVFEENPKPLSLPWSVSLPASLRVSFHFFTQHKLIGLSLACPDLTIYCMRVHNKPLVCKTT